MVTPDDAINYMEAMVRNLPEKHGEIGFLVSKEIAQGIYDYNFNRLTSFTRIKAESWQDFEYRGIKCRVA